MSPSRSGLLRYSEKGLLSALGLPLAAKAILKPSDRVAYLAGSLVGFTFGLQLGIAGDLASRLLDSAFGLLR
jgi:hypothetical protein